MLMNLQFPCLMFYEHGALLKLIEPHTPDFRITSWNAQFFKCRVVHSRVRLFYNERNIVSKYMRKNSLWFPVGCFLYFLIYQSYSFL